MILIVIILKVEIIFSDFDGQRGGGRGYPGSGRRLQADMLQANFTKIKSLLSSNVHTGNYLTFKQCSQW